MSPTPKRNEPETSKGQYAKSWTCVWLAMGFAAIGLLVLAWNYYLIKNSSTALGTVVSVERSRMAGTMGTADNHFTYKPLFSFTDENGEFLKRGVRVGDTSWNYEIGTELEVAYPLGETGYVNIVEWSENLFYSKICFAIAGFWILWFFMTRRNAAKLEAEGR